MVIRRATETDMSGINNLLNQVLEIHHKGRPDIFKSNTKKYTDSELSDIINDDTKPIFVAVDENDFVMGYAFCVFVQHVDNNILTDIKTLYIDDLCVDENIRGQGIGKHLYDYVADFAKQNDCYNITLNVWSLNDDAMKFYEKLGMLPQKVYMESII